MRISDWSSDVCSSDLFVDARQTGREVPNGGVEKLGLLEMRAVAGAVEGYGTGVGQRGRDIIGGVRAIEVAFGAVDDERSDERRVGKECVSTCRSRWSPDH